MRPANGGEPASGAPDFAGRYQLQGLLGRGGMASVHRALDRATGRIVALKQLLQPAGDERRATHERLFEREFHTLSQLSHPCVIAVYDFGVTNEGVNYYTMELLDGGDLLERAPLPWQEACRLLFDVCSSLALLHSRRLLHRDISPRNIRCTHGGRAKLIDFGAMAPMSGGGNPIVGTPAFIAPETLHRSALDARTDLYSLGASFYFALTGQLPYPARALGDLLTVWNDKPVPPSTRVPGIPPALDDLVMSLLSIEPALRPPSAFAVMQRLTAIADLPNQEAASVSQAYLTTPALAGREAVLADLRGLLLRALSVGGKGVMLRADAGLGRSRILDACVLEAKTLGARVLRATASGTTQDFEVALALVQHLVDALPSSALADQFPQLFELERSRPQLRDFASLRADPEQLQHSVARLLRAASKLQPIVLAVDDVQRIDEPSAAVIAELIDRSRHGRAFVALTVENGAPSTQALEVLSRRCELRMLAPLTLADTHTLFGSVFGEVPNLTAVVEEIYGIARGNPRQSIDLAQHLIDHGKITYAAGIWTLPSGLKNEDLPRSAEAAIRARIEALSPLARVLAEAHALSFVERFSHDAYRSLAVDADPSAVDAAVNELLAQQALVGDGESYAISNRLWGAALEAGLDASTRATRHGALREFFQPHHEIASLHHAFRAGAAEQEAALDELLALQQRFTNISHTQLVELQFGKLALSYPIAIAVAERLGRPVRQVHDLLHWLTMISIASAEPSLYWQAAPRWLLQLTHDTGLDLFRLDDQNSDPGARLTTALTKAIERYNALPERERAYRVDEAIPLLASYVAVSIAIGVRTIDVPLLQTLAPLLEPFAPLSPLLQALWQNTVGTFECYDRCHYERARARWLDVYKQLEHLSEVDLVHVTAIRNAIAYAVGSIEAFIGLASAESWADKLDSDPYQRVSGLYLRKVVRLSQGDWAGADALQRQAEVLALQARVPQMFTTTLTVEISAHAYSNDLAGVKDVIERERLESARYPGWTPYLCEAEARFDLIRGNYASAKARYDKLLAEYSLDERGLSKAMPAWIAAQGGMCEALLGLDRPTEAHASARAALAVCEQHEIWLYRWELLRMLALSEAKLGDFASATARLDRLLAEQTEFGVTGLRIGVSYEARAEVALWSGDAAAFDHFARLTAREYRHGANSPLGARYERLTREAQRRGLVPSTSLSDFEPTTMAHSGVGEQPDVESVVEMALAGSTELPDRCLKALRLVCGARAARGGHLFLAANDGPQLMASCDLAQPADGLSRRVREYLIEQEDRFDTMTIAVGEDQPIEVMNDVAVASVDGLEYELLPLTSVESQELRIAAVLAIAPGEHLRNNPRQTQLLSTIAAHLVKGR